MKNVHDSAQLPPPIPVANQRSALSSLQTPQKIKKRVLSQEQLLRHGPLNIILIRHGESEANQIRKLLEEGKITDRRAQELLSEMPDHRVRLADRGCIQAHNAGKWLATSGVTLDPRACYVSDYIRAMETALHFAQGARINVSWKQDPRIGERGWGIFHQLDQSTRQKAYQEREDNPRHWVPMNGESLRTVSLHVGDFIDRLYREHGGSTVVVVTHGECITAFRSALERMNEVQLSEAVIAGVPNGGILHYSRVDPKTKTISRSFDWMRCCDQNARAKNKLLWNGAWRSIVRPRLTNDELAAAIERSPKRTLL